MGRFPQRRLQSPRTQLYAHHHAASDGVTSVTRTLPITNGTDVGNSMIHVISPVDRVRVRFDFFLDTAVDGTLKFQIYEHLGTGAQFGGVYFFDGVMRWFFIDWYGFTSSQHLRIADLSAVQNAWHTLEVDYWRNGHPSGFPAVGLWLDGTQITSGSMPAGASFDANGYALAGTRTNGPSPLPLTAGKIASVNALGVLNGSPHNTIAGQVWVDRFSISSLGRIGN